MQTLLITPKNQIALNKLNSLLKEMKDDFATQKVSEGDIYYPELDKKLKKARKNREQGKTTKLDTSSFENFLKSIQES